MNDSTCPRPCLMKLDLQSSTNKLAFYRKQNYDVPFACWMWCWLLWLKMNASVRIGKSFVWY